jgi:hypothetical protein
LITFLYVEIATSINIYVHLRLSQIMISGLLLGVVLLIFACWFHDTVTLTTWLVYVEFRTWLYECSLFSRLPFPCICQSVVEGTHSIMSLYVLFFCQYRACWYNVVSFLVILLIQSAYTVSVIVIFLLYDFCFVNTCLVPLLFDIIIYYM